VSATYLGVLKWLFVAGLRNLYSLCKCSIFVGCKITKWQFDGNRQVKFAMKVHGQHCYMSHSLLFVAEQLQVHSMSVI